MFCLSCSEQPFVKWLAQQALYERNFTCGPIDRKLTFVDNNINECSREMIERLKAWYRKLPTKRRSSITLDQIQIEAQRLKIEIPQKDSDPEEKASQTVTTCTSTGATTSTPTGSPTCTSNWQRVPNRTLGEADRKSQTIPEDPRDEYKLGTHPAIVRSLEEMRLKLELTGTLGKISKREMQEVDAKMFYEPTEADYANALQLARDDNTELEFPNTQVATTISSLIEFSLPSADVEAQIEAAFERRRLAGSCSFETAFTPTLATLPLLVVTFFLGRSLLRCLRKRREPNEASDLTEIVVES